MNNDTTENLLPELPKKTQLGNFFIPRKITDKPDDLEQRREDLNEFF